MMLWSQDSAATATGGKAQGRWEATRVAIDSRTLQPGDMFVAIKGENFDGHMYAADALKAGAAAVVVSRVPEGLGASAPLLLVGDTMKALEDLGRAGRARSKARVVGVTGSVGKTSTKDMLHLALSAHGKTYATSGNLNNHIGTPLNLANLPADADFAVLEMGMNHAGEITPLTAMVQPDIAVVTGVEAVHLEFFASEQEIATAKAEIFTGVKSGGAAVLNADNRHFAQLKEAAKTAGIARIIACGAGEEADMRLLGYATTTTGCSIDVSIAGQQVRVALAAIGRHWGGTALLTLAVSHAFALPVEKTIQALAHYCEPQGRGQLLHLQVAGGDIMLVDDSYNASPASMRAGLAKTHEIWLAHGSKGRKVAILGDMLELGDAAVQMHIDLAADLKHNGFDAVFTAGQSMRHLHEALPQSTHARHAEDSAKLLPLVAAELRAGDIVLIKGSHGSKMYQLAGSLPGALNEEEKKHAV